MIANCFRSCGLRLYDSRDSFNRPRFHHVTLRSRYLNYNVDSFVESYSLGLDSRWHREDSCCSPDSISFHFVKTAVAMRTVHFLAYYRALPSSATEVEEEDSTIFG